MRLDDRSREQNFISFALNKPGGACCVNQSCVETNSQEECQSLGGAFLPGQSCGPTTCQTTPCGCTMFFDRVRLLVADCESNIMRDRTSEATNGFSWNPVHNYATGQCSQQGCQGGDTHLTCQVFSNEGISWCGYPCGCSYSGPNPWYLEDPAPGPGCTAPENRQPYDPESGFITHNSVNLTQFASVLWKPGYPDALEGAPWFVWRDFSGPHYGQVDQNCTLNCS